MLSGKAMERASVTSVNQPATTQHPHLSTRGRSDFSVSVNIALEGRRRKHSGESPGCLAPQHMAQVYLTLRPHLCLGLGLYFWKMGLKLPFSPKSLFNHFLPAGTACSLQSSIIPQHLAGHRGMTGAMGIRGWLGLGL